jgi:hypothetical protein
MNSRHRSSSTLTLLSLSFRAMALALVLAACEEDSVTGPRLRPGDANLDIEVTPGSIALDIQMDGASVGGFGPNYCPFILYVGRTQQNPWGQWVREVCTNASGELAATVPNLPLGAQTFDLRFNAQRAISNDQQPIVASATVTLEAATQASAVFELNEKMGIVEGQITLNGQAVPTGAFYSVCSGVNEAISPCAPARGGTFKFLDLAGDRASYFRGGDSYTWNPGAPIAFVNYNVGAGATTALLPTDLVTSKLRPTFRFGNKTLAELGPMANGCEFSLYIDRPATNPDWHFGRQTNWICGAALTTPFELNDMPVGDHTFDLRFNGPPATSGMPQALAGSARVSLSAGSTGGAEFDLAATMGYVTGRLAIEGDVSPNGYIICLASGGWTSCIHWTQDPNATFGFFDLPGDRTAVVLRNDASQARLASFSYTVSLGGEIDLGPVSDRPPLVFEFKFDGSPLDGLGEGFANWNCPFSLYRDPGPNPWEWGTWVQSICADANGSLASVPVVALTPGQRTIQLRYNGPPAARGQPQAVVYTANVLVESGKTLTQAIDLKDQMGLVTGTLKINGQVPDPSQLYQICARQEGGWGWPCAWVARNTGLFKYVDLPGARSGLVKVAFNSVEISNFGYTVVAGQTTIVGTTTGGVHGETPAGTDVKVTPVESNTGGTPVTLTFTNVGTAGITTISGDETAPTPPPDADAVTLFYEIATSAVFTGSIEVCINFPATVANPERLQLLHFENDQWVDVTSDLRVADRVICGRVSSLSPFVVVLPRNVAPVAVIRWLPSGEVGEGSTVTFDGSGSRDDGTIEKYEWDWNNDGAFDAEGASVTHVFADNGPATVALRVKDNLGVTNRATATVTVVNVAPAVRMPSDVTLIDNETFTGAGSFADPGADSWTATVSYGEGGTAALTLSAKSFQLSHPYRVPGRFTIAVEVSDDDNGRGTGTTAVVVLSHQDAIRAIIASLTGVVDASGKQGLVSPLEAAIGQLDRRNYKTAINQIEAYINQLAALVRSGRLSADAGAVLTAAATRVIRAIELEGTN